MYVITTGRRANIEMATPSAGQGRVDQATENRICQKFLTKVSITKTLDKKFNDVNKLNDRYGLHMY